MASYSRALAVSLQPSAPTNEFHCPRHAPLPASCSLTPLPRTRTLPDEVAPCLVATSHDEGPCAPQFSSPPYRRHRKSPQLLLSRDRVSSPKRPHRSPQALPLRLNRYHGRPLRRLSCESLHGPATWSASNARGYPEVLPGKPFYPPILPLAYLHLQLDLLVGVQGAASPWSNKGFYNAWDTIPRVGLRPT